jgi:hypothetical protein
MTQPKQPDKSGSHQSCVHPDCVYKDIVWLGHACSLSAPPQHPTQKGPASHAYRLLDEGGCQGTSVNREERIFEHFARLWRPRVKRASAQPMQSRWFHNAPSCPYPPWMNDWANQWSLNHLDEAKTTRETLQSVVCSDFAQRHEGYELFGGSHLLEPETIDKVRAPIAAPPLAEALCAILLGSADSPALGPRRRLRAMQGPSPADAKAWAQSISSFSHTAYMMEPLDTCCIISLTTDAILGQVESDWFAGQHTSFAPSLNITNRQHNGADTFSGPPPTIALSSQSSSKSHESTMQKLTIASSGLYPLRLAWRVGHCGATLALLGLCTAIEENCPVMLVIADGTHSFMVECAPI